jgi:hypothetical protein
MEDLDEVLIWPRKKHILKEFVERRLRLPAVHMSPWKDHTMNVKRFYAGLTGVVLAGGLAACGSAAAPRTAVTVTATPTPTVTVTPTPTPIVTKAKPVVVVPAQTVYAPAAPAAPALTNCGGVYAGPNTSCPFAVNVEQTWLTSGAIETFSVYSPVTGLSYVMTCGGIDPTVCTGGNNALVEFYN